MTLWTHTGVLAVSTISNANQLSAVGQVTASVSSAQRQGQSGRSVRAVNFLPKDGDSGVLGLSSLLVVFL